MTPRRQVRTPYFRSAARRGRRPHPGLVLIAALVCLLIVTSLVASMLQGTLRARRQLRDERDLRQTELLVEGGADRAAAQLAADPGFRGDTWELPADAIVGRGAGRVTTQISRGSDGEPPHVHVVAEYPLEREFPIRRSKTFPLPFPSILSRESTP